MLKAILVDDEKSACDALKTFIESYFSTQMQVVGIAHNCLDVVPLINQFHPDVVFLDISMPQGTVFDLFNFFFLVNLSLIVILNIL